LISCANHDYVEIACMYGFIIRLYLKSGTVVEGEAFQTAFNADREECVLVKTASGHEKIALDQVVVMEAVTKNPHFEKIEFL